MAAPLALEPIALVAADGARSEALIARAAPWSGQLRVIVPAMGVSARYYEPLALALAVRGIDVLVHEHRGVGSSDQVPGRAVDFGYHHMVSHDLVTTMAAARSLFSPRRLTMVGHSLGAQLTCLYVATHPAEVDDVCLIAGGTVDLRAYGPVERLRVLGGTQAARWMAVGLGWFPGDKVGFGGRQPRTLIRDWAHLCLTGRFEPRGADVDYEAALASARPVIRAISIEGDTYAPASALDRLCAKMPLAQVRRHHLELPRLTGNKHFRWVREPASVTELLAG